MATVIGNASTIGGNIELSIIGPSDSAGAIFKSSSTTFTSYYPASSSTTSTFSRRSDSQSNDTTVTTSTTTTTTESPESIIPIRIDPGTKKLVLARKLDKESSEGELGITIGVRCRPRKRSRKSSNFSDDQLGNSLDELKSRSSPITSNDPKSSYWIYDHSSSNSNIADSKDEMMIYDDIIIPIKILVTDANDNRPEWQGHTPYRVNVSEMTSVGSTILTGIRALDNDQLGPYSTVEYYVEQGPYSHLLRFISPLEGTLILAAPLDFETLPTFTVTIRAQDQGNPPNSATTKVEVRVIDADDQNPRFEMDKYTAIISDTQRPGDPLPIQPRRIKAEDPDRGIRSPIVYGFNSRDEEANKENSNFVIDPNTGDVSLRRSLPSSVQLPVTLVIRATQNDNRDRYALTTLTILSRRNQIMPELPESSPSISSLRFQILDDDEGYFSIRSSGEIVVKKPLDYEKHKMYSFRTMVTDGRQSDVARITVQILNVNEHDPIFGKTGYMFHVNEARLRSSPIIGQIQATDADDGDRIQISLSGPHAAAFALSASDGTLRLRSLRLVNTTECHLIATATDSGSPPRSSSASVVVKFSPSLLKSFNGRTLSGDPGSTTGFFFTDWEDSGESNDLDRASSSSSPSASDILHHGASNLFNASANSTALVLVIVLGVLLGTLFIIIVALTLHVLKNRKYESGRSGSPATASLHHPVTGSLVGSSAASTTSSSRIISPTNGKSNVARNSSMFFHGFRLGANKVSPSELNTTSPDDYDDNQEYESEDLQQQQHRHHHHHNHHPHHHQHQNSSSDSSKSNQRRTFMDTIEFDSNNSGINKNIGAINELDSAISSDLSTSSEVGATSSTNVKQDDHSSNQPDHSSDHSSRSSSAELVKNLASNGTVPSDSAMGSRISVIKWPQGSIPRRVKKLTWQDEQRNNHLDQMYTSNQTVMAANHMLHQTNGVSTKTKTLSGHLLTGNQPVNTYSIKSNGQPPAVAPKPSTKTFGQFMPRIDVSSPPPPSTLSVSDHPHHHHHHSESFYHQHQPSSHHVATFNHPHMPSHHHTQQSSKPAPPPPPQSSTQLTTTTSSSSGGNNLPDLTVYF
ncbi:hypothetical protein RDWZM_003827 [Blomia tropicalis]|uniref:Cadherin domain-containing protein n=1 Tax=Blomia tropicalis TaxID=40697 RepID=A0A9Q0MJ07_BLOTA|nr:hypothetical protein RDWZM_003827 [Blomia tropicalis]